MNFLVLLGADVEKFYTFTLVVKGEVRAVTSATSLEQAIGYFKAYSLLNGDYKIFVS